MFTALHFFCHVHNSKPLPTVTFLTFFMTASTAKISVQRSKGNDAGDKILALDLSSQLYIGDSDGLCGIFPDLFILGLLHLCGCSGESPMLCRERYVKCVWYLLFQHLVSSRTPVSYFAILFLLGDSLEEIEDWRENFFFADAFQLSWTTFSTVVSTNIVGSLLARVPPLSRVDSKLPLSPTDTCLTVFFVGIWDCVSTSEQAIRVGSARLYGIYLYGITGSLRRRVVWRFLWFNHVW